jgi:hypothetical protein
MAITNGDTYIGASKQLIPYKKTTAITTVAQLMFSLLDVAGNPSAGSLSIGNTTNGLVPTDATAGFPVINAFGSGAKGYLTRIAFGSNLAGRFQLWDRLFHVGSISLTTLATTTLSSQPSYVGRLPNSDYKNTYILLEINTAVSATATTVTVNYTNQDGTTGRTTGSSGSLSGFTNKRVLMLPLQAGDSGVQKIESVVVGGTVATAGTVNVIVARLLASSLRVLFAGHGDVLGLDRTGLPEVFADSALWLTVEMDSTSSGIPDLHLEIANG